MGESNVFCIGIALALVLSCTMPAGSPAQVGGKAGAFTRLGYGARAQGMGNAMTAVATGVIAVPYNPALSPFQRGHILYGTYGILSLDRKLNQLFYTQSIRILRKGARKYSEDPDAQSLAGVSAGWVNAGDADIQGYDSDGFPTETFSMFENQFYLNFGTRLTERFSAGFSAKFYYSGLYRNLTSSGFGLDFGMLYRVSECFSVGFVVQDLLTKYKWDTSVLYGPENGRSTEDEFPLVLRAGLAAVLKNLNGILLAADIEWIGRETLLLRVGAELQIAEPFAVRAGIDRLDLSGDGIAARPSCGISFSQPIASFRPELVYAIILEPVAPSPTHALSFVLSF
ncbi:MAG: hypothetical protein QHI48_03025 [Bacteroidota bacterium]|nr:hypothetical protein [Bacteroidota bacterium]